MNRKYKYDELEKSLLDYGLTSKQSRVYLASLQLGTSNIQAIAAKAGVERTNTYDAIKGLIDRRLISITTKGKKRLFVAEPPESLKTIIKEKEKKLKSLLPELRLLHNVSEFKPKIRFYPGVEGYKSVYEDTLGAKNKLLFGIYSSQDIIDVLGIEFIRHIIQERVKNGIILRVIRPRETEVPGLWPATKEELREVRLAPEGMTFPIVTFVYDNKVIYLSSKKETFGLIIESHDIAQAHQNYFKALWQISVPHPYRANS